MRWTLGRYQRVDGSSDWYVTKPGNYAEEVEVVPASFTDEDVERVADRVLVAWKRYGSDPDFATQIARAALSAYLQG